MAPFPNIIYDITAKNGKKSFKFPYNFVFNEENFNTDKIEIQIGFIYQENSISEILSNFDSQEVDIFQKNNSLFKI